MCWKAFVSMSLFRLRGAFRRAYYRSYASVCNVGILHARYAFLHSLHIWIHLHGMRDMISLSIGFSSEKKGALPHRHAMHGKPCHALHAQVTCCASSMPHTTVAFEPSFAVHMWSLQQHAVI